MYDIREFVDQTPGHPPVRGFLHTPEAFSGDGLILTHGAGVNCQSPLLRKLADAFCESGMMVLRCDLPFRQLRPHGPPLRGSAEEDRQGLRRAVELIRQQISGRVFLGGHSYGGRQATILAAGEPGLVEGLLLLSYPLHPPKRPDQLRTAHFSNLRTPALFAHGTRDGFGTIDELTAALKLIPAKTELLAIADVGHELLSKRGSEEVPDSIVNAFATMFRAG
jgi:predicted alpha/beta-hydrolase family hydrolase